MHWHQKGIGEVLKETQSSMQGLPSNVVQERLRIHGPNVLTERRRKPPVIMFLGQFSDFMIIILIAAAIISGIIGEPADTITIIVIVVVNAIVGFIQEFRAEKAIAALKKMAAPSATVIRDGRFAIIEASQLVPGDLVTLDAGGIVPADMRLLEVERLKLDESALTGESVPVDKQNVTLNESNLPLGDRRNMVFKGTIATYGRGAGIVIATGADTELGKIASMLQEEEEVKTPLQKRLAAFGRKLAIAVLVICAVIFGIGLLRGVPVMLMLLTAISLAVAAIPEALPAVITISLALGARKLAVQNALIRRLPAVETLGSVTYICSDKTGTLTMNRMTVERIYSDGVSRNVDTLPAGPISDADKSSEFPGSAISALLTASAVSNDAHRDASGNLAGDPTEIALYELAERFGYKKPDLEELFKRVSEIPFESERKCMTTVHSLAKGGFVSFTKGAAETIAEISRFTLTSAGLKAPDAGSIRIANDEMASNGLRVIGVSMKLWDRLPEDLSPEKVENDLTFLGLVGIIDPPREEVKVAVAMCKSAGIRPVMITGDHPLTAKAVARRSGIMSDYEHSVITGAELARLSEQEFAEKVGNIQVYARVAPEQKLRIVRALQEKGQFVAMTGDGVNDAPALKRADIGIAMGITGTDVSKQSAHMILLDDNFATIVNAVREGRMIYDNIRKFIKYLLTTNSGEIWTLFLAPLAGLPIPLLPIHILWINLVTDGLPALALSVEPAEGDVMKRPPRHPRESIFAGGLGIHAIWVGLLMAASVLFVQAWAIRTEDIHWQTMVFTVLCLTQLGHCLAIRSERESLFSIGLLSNKYLFGAVFVTFILQMATVYVPALNPIFKTQPLNLNELILVIAFSSVVFFAVELEKLFKRRSGRS